MDAAIRIKTKTPSPYKLIAVEVDTHDTKPFRFELPADATLDMLPGDFLYVHATLNGKQVKRAYTPSSLPGNTGSFDLTVKRYETGTISKYLHEQQIGNTVLMSGPNTGGHWVDGMAKRVGFVAGGTGVASLSASGTDAMFTLYDAEGGAIGSGTSLSFDAVHTTTYYVLVESSSGTGTGSYSFSLSGPDSTNPLASRVGRRVRINAMSDGTVTITGINGDGGAFSILDADSHSTWSGRGRRCVPVIHREEARQQR